jgi:superfamily I DNA/RNA helicase
LFKDIHNRHLVKLGVPEDLLPLVRAITNDDQLEKALFHIPVEAHEALIALAADYSLDEVMKMYDKTSEDDSRVDTEDFETALENPDTKSRFVVVDDDIALQEILEAPLEKWRVFLHPSQRSMVERDWNGPVRVLGGAGTGKTVVAIHRAKYLAEQVFTGEHDRILFTTFTRNLAADIIENLSKICPDKLMRRIEVVNLDRWVSLFLKKHDYTHNIDYGKRTKPLWNKALTLAPGELNLDDSFYHEEWVRVIQPYGITKFSEYLKVPRIGRGVRLNRNNRKDIWPVFEEYRVLLNENNLREVDDAMRDACAIIREKGDILPYCSVIVDEAQDMGTQAFSLIRQIVGKEKKNDIFVVGDAHQRIYRHKVVLGQCGIKIVGRGRKLRINYRTTEENRRWAVNLLRGVSFDDLDGGVDDHRGYRSLLHGVYPKIEFFTSFKSEVKYITDYLNGIISTGKDIKEICLVARTNELIKHYEAALNGLGITTYFIMRNRAEDRKKEGVRLATMHRVKGLEFKRVIVAGVNDGVLPFELNWIRSSDQVIKKDFENQEKALLYVAVTRARKEVLVTSFGKNSRFLQKSI